MLLLLNKHSFQTFSFDVELPQDHGLLLCGKRDLSASDALFLFSCQPFGKTVLEMTVESIHGTQARSEMRR